MINEPADSQQQQDVEKNSENPGHVLMNGRQNREWSVEFVAERLKLSPVQVQALEHCDFPSLPEPPFIRGYIRNYARLLQLNPDRVVADFDAVMKKYWHNEAVLVGKFNSRPQSRKSVAILVFCVVFMILTGLSGYYWWNSQRLDLVDESRQSNEQYGSNEHPVVDEEIEEQSGGDINSIAPLN